MTSHDFFKFPMTIFVKIQYFLIFLPRETLNSDKRLRKIKGINKVINYYVGDAVAILSIKYIKQQY